MKSAILVSAILVSAILVVPAGDAAAQPGMTPQGAPLVLDPVEVEVEPKSEGLALGMSIGGTVVSWGLVYVSRYGLGHPLDNPLAVIGAATLGGMGAVAAPSLGHWYAGKLFTRGLAVRAVGAATMLIGVSLVISDTPVFSDSDAGPGEVSPWAWPLVYAGGAILAIGTIDDLLTTPGRVRRRNREHGFALAPVVTARSAGVAIGGRF